MIPLLSNHRHLSPVYSSKFSMYENPIGSVCGEVCVGKSSVCEIIFHIKIIATSEYL